MPSSAEHLDQSDHNLQFLKLFYGKFENNDWAITVGFYAAVHIVEYAVSVSPNLMYKGKNLGRLLHSDDLKRIAAKRNIPPPNNIRWQRTTPHFLRNILVRANFKPIESAYLLLYRKSRSARYEYYQFSDSETKRLVETVVVGIVGWCNKEFGTSLPIDFS